MTHTDGAVLVFDIGKTHAKVTLVGPGDERLASARTPNRVLPGAPYAHLDLDGIWAWFCDQVAELAAAHPIRAVSIATHGAAAVLIDGRTGAPLLPAMDYEWDGYAAPRDAYEAIRPGFDTTFSPSLPAGLNLGRQLHHQAALLAEEERAAAILLTYPAYWAWRLTGVASSEVTSLGCHTDLWDIREGTPSALLKTLGLGHALPPLRRAWEPLGPIESGLAERLGLSSDCLVYPGVHDSNAGFVSRLAMPPNERPLVVSTGTWAVAMRAGAPLSLLDERRDMLCNVDAAGTPLATARAMVGREVAAICETLSCGVDAACGPADIEAVIAHGAMALPSFAPGTGPFPDANGHLSGGATNGRAVATLYAALVIDEMILRLGDPDEVVIEGSYAGDALLCGLVAGLRPGRIVRPQTQGGGVVTGCVLLTAWGDLAPPLKSPAAAPFTPEGLEAYRQTWHARAEPARQRELTA